jgi:hypothetical protein
MFTVLKKHVNINKKYPLLIYEVTEREKVTGTKVVESYT